MIDDDIEIIIDSFPWLFHPPLSSFQLLPWADCTHKLAVFYSPDLKHINYFVSQLWFLVDDLSPFSLFLNKFHFQSTCLSLVPPAWDDLSDPFLVSLFCLNTRYWATIFADRTVQDTLWSNKHWCYCYRQKLSLTFCAPSAFDWDVTFLRSLILMFFDRAIQEC